ncbi:MAG: magnesium transporter [Gammaproteobacteria bacterium]|nr:magnesium transporter [Gammaproteobacteria bacterium]UCG18958.1 MAG: magnesium transporter [Thiotrichales bacterium]
MSERSQVDAIRERDEPLLVQVLPLLEEGHYDVLADLLQAEHETDLAVLLESLPAHQRLKVWELIPNSEQGNVLLHLHDEVRASLIAIMPHQELVDALEPLDADDIAYVLEDVPEAKSDAILEQLDHETRADVEESLSYPEGTAGRLMRFDAIEVRADIDIYTVLRYLRRHKILPDQTDGLMVVDEDGYYLGKLNLSTLVTQPGSARVESVMDASEQAISAYMEEDEVAHLFDRRDLVSVAVVDASGKFIGRVTVDDVLDVIRGQSERALMGMAGLDEEADIFAPVFTSAKRRALWLGINLCTASLAAWVIGQFEASIAQLVALAILMPIVASMGGVAGSQTLTLTVRGLALGQVSLSNMRWLLRRELGVGLLNSLLWASMMGLVAWLIFEPGVGAVIAAALTINMTLAVGAGVFIPIVLDRLGIDPALSASMILMTITDVMGFLTFLGLATIFLL